MSKIIKVTKILLNRMQYYGHKTSCFRCGYKFKEGDKAITTRTQGRNNDVNMKIYCLEHFWVDNK